MITDDELERWLRTRRTIRKARDRNYLNQEVNTTTEAPEDWDEETTTTYEPHRNTEYSLTPENRHERRKAEAIARKNSKPRSNHASNRFNRKGRKR
jgi:hypothetical protein